MSLAGCFGVEGVIGQDISGILTRQGGLSQHQILSRQRAWVGVSQDSELWDDPASGVTVAFEGVLFDTDEIRTQLRLEGNASSAQIAAEAYLSWSETFPDRLDGEFACAVLDSGGNRVLLCRSAIGRIPLHIAPVGKGAWFASDLTAFAGCAGVDGRINEKVMAQFLTMQPGLPEELGDTLFRGVRTVQPGTVLVLELGKPSREVAYWNPLARPMLRLRDPRGYAEALREAMVRAVERRLPQTGQVGSHLSSGFDSSSVTALTAQALARQNRSLVAYTSVPSVQVDAKKIVSNRFGDEWPLAVKVAGMYPNVEHVAIPTDGMDWWQALDQIADHGGPTPFLRNARWYVGILQDAHRRGLVSMLEGQAGNLVGSYDGGFGLYDLRMRGEWSTLLRATIERKAQGQSWKSLVRDIWMPSPQATARLNRLRGRRLPRMFELSLIRREFYESFGFPENSLSALGMTIEGDRSSGPAWRLTFLRANDFGMMGRLHKRVYGIRREDPTADRRLVELVLSIPDHAFAPRGVRRDLYRQAFANDLPHELLYEPLRGLQGSDFLQMFDAWTPQAAAELERLEASPLASRILDLPRMRRMLEEWPQAKAGPPGRADTLYNYTFGSALSLGRYLRRWEQGSATG